VKKVRVKTTEIGRLKLKWKEFIELIGASEGTESVNVSSKGSDYVRIYGRASGDENEVLFSWETVVSTENKDE